MAEREARRVYRELSPDERKRLDSHREAVARELPDLEDRQRMRRAAAEEQTLSGELRRAIHASCLSMFQIAEKAEVSPLEMDEFLTAERAFTSDVMDRLAAILGYELVPMEPHSQK